MNTCASCVPFKTLNATFAEIYVHGYGIVGPVLAEIMWLGVFVVMAYGLSVMLWRPANFMMETYVRNILFWMFIATLLAVADGWWVFFNFMSNIGPWLGTQLMIKFANVTPEREGLMGLLEIIEGGFYRKMETAFLLWFDDISLFSKMLTWAGSVILGCVYLIVCYQLFWGILHGYIKIIAIGVLSPFIVFFMAFDFTRPMSIAGIRVLLAATLSLFIACVVTATVLLLFQQMQAGFEFTQVGGFLTASEQFLTILMSGLAMILVHSVFMDVVNQITLTFGAAAKAHWGSVMSKVLGGG